jgi:GTPase KRas protein
MIHSFNRISLDCPLFSLCRSLELPPLLNSSFSLYRSNYYFPNFVFFLVTFQVILGSGGVGKSALTIRLVSDNFYVDYDPTIEDSYRRQVMVDDEPAMLDITDTAGQEEFNSMQDQWMRDGKGFLLVYSITSRPSFEEVSVLRDKIIRTKESDKVPIVLCGNKCDLKDERQVQYNEGQDLASKWGIPFFETSAKNKLNSETCFVALVKEVRNLNKSANGGRNGGKKKACNIL